MDKFIVWYEDGNCDHCGNMTAEEVIAKYKNGCKKVTTVTNEFYVNGKYLGEADYSFEEFCKEWA